MGYSVCSYAMNRTFTAGKMDMFRYITWCKNNGFTQLDPWMHHLRDGYNDNDYIKRVRTAAKRAKLPMGCIAVDGGHIYEAKAADAALNRQRACRWINIAAQLEATQVRIDAGGREVPFDEIFPIVVAGYTDLIQYAKLQGIEIIIENHWGVFQHPDNLYKLLDAVPGLGLLFDSNNWPEGTHARAWPQYAKYARLTHMKTFSFDANGNDPDWDIAGCIKILQQAGYNGVWGIESVPKDGDELGGVLKTLALIKRTLGDTN